MKNLIQRKKTILDLLVARDDWVTSTQLAAILDLSDRTIRKEIAELGSELKSFGLAIASSRGKGYSLSSRDKKRIGEMIGKESTFAVKDHYPTYINILLCLIDANEYSDIDDISDMFYLSRTAVENELKTVRRYLDCHSNGLFLIRKKNAVFIEGPEKEKRFIINSIIVSDTHSKLSLDLKAYTPYFDYQQLIYCKNILCQLLGEHSELQITDIGIVAIIIHTMIALKRIQRGFPLDSSYVAQSRNDCEGNLELFISNRLWDSLQKRFRVYASIFEREAIACFISLRRVFFAEGITIEDLNCNATREYLQLTRTIIAELKDVYLLDLTWDNDLLIGLTTHLKSLADRVNWRSHYVNPILKDFKDQYPFIFELAIYARRRIMTLKGMLINEDEVGYLAIHFGASVERLKHVDKQGRIRAVLLCHTGNANSKFLLAKLKSVFGEQLEISGPYSSFHFSSDVLSELSPQLILSTASVEMPADIESLVINPLLDRSDIQQIQRRIAQIEKMSYGIFRMRRFFLRDFFFGNLQKKGPDEIIAFIADKLIQSGRVLPNFKKLVFEREQFSPTVIQNFIALPHPAAFCSIETTISVATLPKAIDWYGRKVQLVFMMAIKEGDQRFLKDFYEFIVDLSEDIGRVQRLLRIKDLDTFWEFMLQGANNLPEEQDMQQTQRDSIADLFSESLIFAGLSVAGHEELLLSLGNAAHEAGYVKGSFGKALLEREARYPTGLHSEVMNFAIPHTDAEHVIRPGVIVAKLEKPVPFKEMGTMDQTVDADYVFLLLLNNNGAQIDLLQGLMALCSDEQMACQLNEAVEAHDIYMAITSYMRQREQEVGGGS